MTAPGDESTRTGRGRQQALRTLDDHIFDLAVVGGGILGACVARDAALRGLSTVMVERSDFGSGTSSNSLKVIHGGLRHLQYLDIPEFRRSVAEQRTWLRIAPHLIEPLPVLVPFHTRREGLLLRAGLAANDLLSPGRNQGLMPDRRLPRGRILGRREAASRMGRLEGGRMRGAVVYHDALMYSPERIVLEVLASARAAGALTLNHMECLGRVGDGAPLTLRVVDRLGNQEYPIRARSAVQACGPWHAPLPNRSGQGGVSDSASLSLAWNLVLPDLGLEAAVAVSGRSASPTGSQGRRARRLFLVPWRGLTLAGTGHAPFRDDPAGFRGLGAGDELIAAFLAELNEALPSRPLAPTDILRIDSGLLPARPEESGDHVRLRRRPTIHLDRADDGPVLTLSTVKFTTARGVAESAIDRLLPALGRPALPSTTGTHPLPGAATGGTVDELRLAARSRLDGRVAAEVIEHLVRSYGAGWEAVVDPADRDPRWAHRPDPAVPVIRAQLLHGVRHEMAETVDDLLLRRTGAAAPDGSESPALAHEARSVLEAR